MCSSQAQCHFLPVAYRSRCTTFSSFSIIVFAVCCQAPCHDDIGLNLWNHKPVLIKCFLLQIAMVMVSFHTMKTPSLCPLLYSTYIPAPWALPFSYQVHNPLLFFILHLSMSPSFLLPDPNILCMSLCFVSHWFNHGCSHGHGSTGLSTGAWATYHQVHHCRQWVRLSYSPWLPLASLDGALWAPSPPMTKLFTGLSQVLWE